MTASVPSPSSAAERLMLSCEASLAADPPRVLREARRLRTPSVPVRSRASRRPSKFNAVPPIVITPEPSRQAVQAGASSPHEHVLHERRGR